MDTARVCRTYCVVLVAIFLGLLSPSLAKDKNKDKKADDEATLRMVWPDEHGPALKFAFAKFRQVSSYGGQNSYLTDVTIENVTDKQLPQVGIEVYIMDKDGVRIGDGYLSVTNLAPHQLVRVPFQFTSVGVPARLALSAKKDMMDPKTIPVRIISVPPGAALKVDGQPAGTTPVSVRFTVGNHSLELTKEGYAVGTSPLEVTADELPGGSVTIELGGLSRDTIELRDGNVLTGDVVSVSMTQVVVRVAGQEHAYERNLVKKIILVEREILADQPAKQTVSPASPKQ